ncbi:MAG: plasmid stabilization protein, partial [Hydrogenophilales bacterium CG17_big_fil_post_rev_8_21_14_2_50_63_12]
MSTLRYADSAENDLLDTWLYIATDNPEAADRIIEAIDREARLLLTHPGMGR